jgi:hypothetical protein
MPVETTISLKEGTLGIAGSAFSQCYGLTAIEMPNSLKSIGIDAFSGCTGLTSVVIPDSVKSIGSYAFEYCSGLTSVTIGSGVTTIGENAFSNCLKIKDVYCCAENVPNTNFTAFYSVPTPSATLHVPEASVDAYKATAPWNRFGTVEAIPGGSLRGDANGDGEIGMPDVMFVVNYILGNPAETFNADAADANLDGEIGMPDVMFIVNYILNGKFPDE